MSAERNPSGHRTERELARDELVSCVVYFIVPAMMQDEQVRRHVNDATHTLAEMVDHSPIRKGDICQITQAVNALKRAYKVWHELETGRGPANGRWMELQDRLTSKLPRTNVYGSRTIGYLVGRVDFLKGVEICLHLGIDPVWLATGIGDCDRDYLPIKPAPATVAVEDNKIEPRACSAQLWTDAHVAAWNAA